MSQIKFICIGHICLWCSLNTLFQCFKIILRVLQFMFHILTYHIEAMRAIVIVKTKYPIPFHTIVKYVQLYHHLKIRPVSASQSVYTTQTVTLQKWQKNFLFSSSFSDIWWMFLLLGNVITYTFLQCMAWYLIPEYSHL